MKKDKSIVLNLMTEKGFEVLKTISHFKNLIAFVIIGKDASVNDDYSEKIRTLCIDNNIDFYYRENQPKIDKNIYVIAVSWRWMIKHPKNKLIVFHDSILPKYRGFAPLVNMLINGEKEIGVSAIFGADEYDRGEIIAQKRTAIVYPIKIQEAIQINNENFKSLILEVVAKISTDNDIPSIPQKESDSSYSIWRDYDDYFVDWSKSSNEIKRLIDAVGFPYLGARSKLSDGSEILIKDAEIISDVDCELRHIGKVIFVEQGCPIVICGSGLLKITDASFVETNSASQFLPLKKFRIRFI
ncbi:methionyl-tRNA formyltransferase [Vibrio mimicus]